MASCLWCSGPFTPRQKTARFCCSAHRLRFHEACRLLGERLFNEGAVTVEQLRAERGE